MYTLLVTDFHLKPDTPQDVLTIVDFMATAEKHWRDNMLLAGPDNVFLPDHPLFSTERWRVMLTMSSAYFEEDTDSAFDPATRHVRTQSNLKNYMSEIKHFLNWIGPYIDGDKLPILNGKRFVGRTRYEEHEKSVGLFYENGGVTFGEAVSEDLCSGKIDHNWPEVTNEAGV
jgi:hypothetical protein